MEGKIRVSIIVPVYNVKEYLEECLNSLVNQDFQEYEIILVNDGSTDGSDEICKLYQDRFDNIQYLSQENQGQSAARNNGLKIARGEYILFVDSDDYIVHKTCSTMYAAAIKYDADIVIGDILNEKDRVENDHSFRRCPAEDQSVSTLQYAKCAVENGMYDIVPWIRLVKKEYLLSNDIHFIEGCYYEDQEYTMKLFTIAQGSAIKIRFPFYYYRSDRVGSTTNHPSRKKGTDFLNIIEQMQEEIDFHRTEAAVVQRSILGISYFHFVNLWLKMEYKHQKDLKVGFLSIMKKWGHGREVIAALPPEMKRRLILFIYCDQVLRAKQYLKEKVNRIRKNEG